MLLFVEPVSVLCSLEHIIHWLFQEKSLCTIFTSQKIHLMSVLYLEFCSVQWQILVNLWKVKVTFKRFPIIERFLSVPGYASRLRGMMPNIVEGLPRNVCFRAHPMLRDEASAAPNMPCPMLLLTNCVPDSPTEVLTEIFGPSFSLNHSL